MNIEQIKAQVAEWERLDKERTQGEFVINHNGLIIDNPMSKTIGIFNNSIFGVHIDLQFIQQQPAMFQAVKQLLARVEELEKPKIKKPRYSEDYIEGFNDAYYRGGFLNKQKKGNEKYMRGYYAGCADKKTYP